MVTSIEPFSDHWETLPLPDIISRINHAKSTGKLTIDSTAASRDLLFFNGELRAARSSSESEKLGSWLVSHKVLPEARKQGALLIQEGSDCPPLGHMLVEKGIIDGDELQHHLERLAVTILERATGEKRRKCTFEEDLADGQLDTLPNLSTPQLILIAARALPFSQIEQPAVGAQEHLVVRNGSLDAIVQEFQLTVSESVFLGKLHRAQTLGRLKAIAGLSSEVFLATAYGLKVTGLISISSHPQRKAKVEIKTEATVPSAAKNTKFVHQQGPDAERSEVLHYAAHAKGMSHYELFDIKPQASYQEIFDAWDSFRQRFDPSRSSEAHLMDLEHHLRTVYDHAKSAYEELSSPIERPRYDRMVRTAADSGVINKSSSIPGNSSAKRARESLVKENQRQVERLVRTGDLFSAVKLQEQICDLDPRPDNLVKLAKLMLLNPNWASRALEKLRRAVEIEPTYVEGWLAVAEYWRSQRNAERERKALEQALAASPENFEATERYRSLAGTAQLSRVLQRIKKSQ